MSYLICIVYNIQENYNVELGKLINFDTWLI